MMTGGIKPPVSITNAFLIWASRLAGHIQVLKSVIGEAKPLRSRVA
jgi:hypothetical protein